MSDLDDLTRFVAEDERRCGELAKHHNLTVEQVRLAERLGMNVGRYAHMRQVAIANGRIPGTGRAEMAKVRGLMDSAKNDRHWSTVARAQIIAGAIHNAGKTSRGSWYAKPEDIDSWLRTFWGIDI